MRGELLTKFQGTISLPNLYILQAPPNHQDASVCLFITLRSTLICWDPQRSHTHLIVLNTNLILTAFDMDANQWEMLFPVVEELEDVAEEDSGTESGIEEVEDGEDDAMDVESTEIGSEKESNIVSPRIDWQLNSPDLPWMTLQAPVYLTICETLQEHASKEIRSHID